MERKGCNSGYLSFGRAWNQREFEWQSVTLSYFLSCIHFQ